MTAITQSRMNVVLALVIPAVGVASSVLDGRSSVGYATWRRTW